MEEEELIKDKFPEEGSIVEVKSDEEGLKGVYFTATVIASAAACVSSSSKEKKKKKKSEKQVVVVYVEYQNLLADEKGSGSGSEERLREYADICNVRPLPLQEIESESVRRIEEGALVDAFYKDGWWTGVVKKRVNATRFVVTFEDPPDELEFGLSQLRLHLDWVDGTWVLPHNYQDKAQLDTGEFDQRKKRGRPKKILNESIEKTPVTASGDLSGKDGDPHGTPEAVIMGTVASSSNLEEMALNEDKLTNGHSDLIIGKRNMRKRTLEKVATESAGRTLKRGTRRIKDERTALRVEDSLDASVGKNMEVNCSMEGEKVVTESPCNVPDDAPLSKWIERRHSASITDGSRTSPVSTMEQCTENGEKQRDAVVLEEPEGLTQTSALVDKDPIVSNEHQSLPLFVKNSDCKESLREGLVIGYMVAFSRVVEKASGLQLHDPKSITDDIMETLADLKTYGFDVKVVQDRVTELLELKDKKEKLVNEVHELNNQILEHMQVRNRIEEEIRKLQSAKEKEDGEIASLQARLGETEESILNVGRIFEGIASSTL
ncbi:hypothetical protein BUALT_Bualt09G0014200 [Buddleja alternifolia]|uniref:Agenet domain-containing protein n=1 Tax=Buddleja alternifolia TaxID=168488 RepID=A0AAV6X6A3_9LAMI|nr:hypothetical protein BUALT_Bualt09G0014200 [Buddleja alternifolia]